MFQSFFLGGFECSTQRRRDGRRLDLLVSTGHDKTCESDFRQLGQHGIRTARDGIRWHLVETAPGVYDWSSFMPLLAAAEKTRTQIILDLCHYGWPDHYDIWSPDFVRAFAAFAAATAQVMKARYWDAPIYCPINEISYWAWAGGDKAEFNPNARGRGGELKRQLVRAAIAAIEAIRSVDPRARFTVAEPLINIITGSRRKADIDEVEKVRLYQYEAVDLLLGKLEPELGGRPDMIDIIGVNYYPNNQWYYKGEPLTFGHHSYRPLSDMLVEVHKRYGKPILIAETGAEGSARAAWLHYVCAEVFDAIDAGVPVEGVCLYPILDYPGWVNERLCDVGLLGAIQSDGLRRVCRRTAAELRRQQDIMTESRPERIAG